MTHRELIKAIRNHKGKVLVPVLVPEDVRHLIVQKNDIIESLSQGGEADEPAPWRIVDNSGGWMHLDIQHDQD